MHHIERYILDKIIHAKTLRNRDMRPPRVESNLYQYHLKQVIKSGYIEKNTSGTYELAPKGMLWADRYSGTLSDSREQSKVVSLIAVRDEKGRYLLLEKKRQPFIGCLQFPAGKVHLGEYWADAAQREFTEKVGAEQVDLTYIRSIHVVVRRQDVLYQDYVANLFTATLTAKNIPARHHWFDGSIAMKALLMPGVAEILRVLEGDSASNEVVVSVA